MRCDSWVGGSWWWSCQSPVAHSCSLLNHLNCFHGGMFKLNTKFDVDSFLYLLSHFEWYSHTVHMLRQWYLLLPLTSTEKSSSFTHVHSSPLTIATRLYQWHANHFHINNGWAFFRQTSYNLKPRDLYGQEANITSSAKRLSWLFIKDSFDMWKKWDTDI